MKAQEALPGAALRKAIDAAYAMSPQQVIDHMRVSRRENYLRRFPWLRVKP